MKTYIGVKMVRAQKMTLGDYNLLRKWEMPKDEDPAAEGYLIQYPNDYHTWTPKDVFEQSYLQIDEDHKITDEVVDDFIGNGSISHSQLDEKTTMVKITPRTGFVQYEVSSCVDPANYDHELGLAIATKRIKNRIYPLLGFVLQWAKYGLRPNVK